MKNDEGKIYYGIGLDNDQLKADAIQARNALKGIGDSAVAEGARIDNVYRKIAGTVATVFTVQQAIAFTKQIVQVRGEIQSLEIAFETMLGSKEKADKMMADVKEIALKSPFTLTEVADNTKQLIAMGIASEKAIGTLKILGDVSAGLSVPMWRLAINYGQVSALGKLQTREIRDFAMAGVPIVDELSKILGRASSEIYSMVEAGQIGFPLVEKAFQNMAGAGGKFDNMMEKMNSTVTGQLSKLKDQIQLMFNEIGGDNEGVIYSAIGGAAKLVEHYKEIGKALAELIAAYGVYKGAIIAIEAVKRTIDTVKYTEEAASLEMLLSVEQKEKLSKLGLVKASKEYVAAVEAEVTANVQAAQSSLVKARTDVKAASESVVARRAEYVAAKQMEEQRLAELMSIGATGTAKQVEAAQRKLSTAETQRESAAIAFQSATRDFNAKKTVLETAAKKANAVTTAANTASQTANATVTGFLTVAKTKLTAAIVRLNAVMMKNPYTVAAVAIAALAYGIYKLITYQTDAEKAQKRLNEAIEESEKSSLAEERELARLKGELSATTKGSEEYQKVKDKIVSKFGQYHNGLAQEIETVGLLDSTYQKLTESIQKSFAARQYEKFRQTESENLDEIMLNNLGKIQNKLIDKLGDEAGTKYYNKIRNAIINRTISSKDSAGRSLLTGGLDKDTQAILDNINGKSRGATVKDYTIERAVREIVMAQDDLDKAEDLFLNRVGLTKDDLNGNTSAGGDNIFDAATASLQQLIDRLPKAKEELDALKKAEHPDATAIAAKEKEIQQINAQTAAREKYLKAIKDVKAQIELLQKEQEKYGKDDAEYKALETRIESLKKKLPLTANQSNRAESEAAKLKREAAERVVQKKALSEKEARQDRQNALELRQQKIDLMDEGVSKELAQLDLNYDRALDAVKQHQDELLQAERERRQNAWETDNPKAKEKGDVFDPYTITENDLSDKDKADIRERTDLANSIKAKAEADLLKKYLREYETYEQKKVRISKEYDDVIALMQSKNQDGQYTKNIEKAWQEKDRALAELDASMQASSNLWGRLFDSYSSYTNKQLREIITNAQQVLDYVNGTDVKDIKPKFGMSAEQLKSLKVNAADLSAAYDVLGSKIEELNKRNPFGAMIRNAQLLKKNTADIEDAEQELAAAQASWDKEAIKKAKEKLEALERQKQLLKGGLKEAARAAVQYLGEVGDSLQQIGEASGSSDLASFGKALSEVSDIADKFMSGDIIGGVISTLTVGLTSIFSSRAKYRAALKQMREDRIAFALEYKLAMSDMRLEAEDASNAFLDDAFTKAITALKELKSNYEDFIELVNKNDSANNGGEILAQIKQEKLKVKGFTTDLQSIWVQTRHATWFRKEKGFYLKDMYPELFDGEDGFNVEAARALLNTNNQLNDEAKRQIQEVVDTYDQWKEAEDQFAEYLNSTFGDIGDSLGDSIVDAFKNGTDAMETWGDSFNNVLENLGKQLMQTLFFQHNFDKLEEDLTKIYEDYGNSPDMIALRTQELLGTFFQGMEGTIDQASDWYKNYADMANQYGLDLSGVNQTQTASSKGFQTMSQDTGDELNGRFTAIHMQTTNIAQSVDEMRGLSLIGIDHLAGIEKNTHELLEMNERIEKIVKNTSRI